MNILVYGLGALGTVYACLLKNKGHRVLAMVREAQVETIRNRGVAVTGIWGEYCSKIDVVSSAIADFGNESIDLVLVTVKSFVTEEAARQIAKVLAPGTYVILLQNGYGNYETAAQYLPERQLILGRVIFGAETEDTGKSRVTVIADDVVLGSPGSKVENERVASIAALFNEAGIPTRASEQVLQYLWAKIIYNSALNPLGALLEVNYGRLTEYAETRLLMEGIIGEIFALLQALKQDTAWPDARSYLQDFYGQLVPVTSAHHSSMLQDIKRGRKTEIDALNGAVVRLARQYGVAAPVNGLITMLVKAKEQVNSLPAARNHAT